MFKWCDRGVFRFLTPVDLVSEEKHSLFSLQTPDTFVATHRWKICLGSKGTRFLYLCQWMCYLSFKEFKIFSLNLLSVSFWILFSLLSRTFLVFFLVLPCLYCQLSQSIHMCFLVTWLPAALDRHPIATDFQPSVILLYWWFPFPLLFHCNNNQGKDRRTHSGFLIVPAGLTFFICLKELVSL